MSRSPASEPIVAGLSGAVRDGCVALATSADVLGVCPQERITRVRRAGFNPNGLPDEALDELLHRAGRERQEVSTFVLAGRDDAPGLAGVVRLDSHEAHAYGAFLPSPFHSAAVVVCDREPPYFSVWKGEGSKVERADWPWHGVGLAGLYAECASALGFSAGGEQRLEALARLRPSRGAEWAESLFDVEDDCIRLEDGWRDRVASRYGEGRTEERVMAAAALQSRIGDLLLELLSRVRRHLPDARNLCLGGSLFANSYFNSRVRRGPFEAVFVPVDPVSGGSAVGAALHASGQARRPVTPFLGPSYDRQEIKATLENCKLTYGWHSEAGGIRLAVDALLKGHLVAWFEGAMEFGPRALGARSILASPFGPYVLDNLNRFLKHREAWRGYGLSALEPAVVEHFEGPVTSPFMECDYLPKDRDRFRYVLPEPEAAVRLQTVGPDTPPGFRALLAAFGEATGVPLLVNTSFNGFREPIVCSPRDAIRVFFGTGIDMLALGEFVLIK